MDYTQNEEIMKVLTELSKEVEGFNYSVRSGYSGYSEVIKQRREMINRNVKKLKNLLSD